MSPTTNAPSAASVVRAVLAADATEVLGRLAAIDGDASPEEVHTARLALRRIRIDLRMFRPLVDHAWVNERKRALEALHLTLTAAHHLDARAAQLAAVAEAEPDVAAEADTLAAALLPARRRALAAAHPALSAADHHWLEQLADGDALVPVDDHPRADARHPAAHALPAMLRRPWRHLRVAARAGEAPGAEEDLRVWTRRCRYAAEATASALGPKVARLAIDAAELQLVLDQRHAAQELETEAAELVASGRVSPALAAAMAAHAGRLVKGSRKRYAGPLAAVLGAKALTRTPDAMPATLAAGGVVWQDPASRVEVVLVHRPRHGDWSLPKGSVLAGETPEQGARREVEEETGLCCTLGPEMAPVRYRDRRGRQKVVRFWSMTPVALGAREGDEVDQVRWLPLVDAIALVGKARDREVLESFVLTMATTAPRQLASVGAGH